MEIKYETFKENENVEKRTVIERKGLVTLAILTLFILMSRYYDNWILLSPCR